MATHLKASGKTTFAGTTLASSPLKPQRPSITRPATLAVKAHNVSRREGLMGMVAGVGMLLVADPSYAAYGDPANVLGKVTDTSGFVPYDGGLYALKIPSKWNRSKEIDFPGVVLRYEDNGDAVTNFVVISRKTEKRNINEFGSQEEFIKSTVEPLLGKQVFTGETISEGGFAKDKVSAAALLDSAITQDKNGKSYYFYDILTKAADGNEGGRHQLIKASVSGGQLLILKVQCGDKRWFKGVQKDAAEMLDSFILA